MSEQKGKSVKNKELIKEKNYFLYQGTWVCANGQGDMRDD